MLNVITLSGRLTKDPELRKTQDGTSVCSITLACERDIKSANGNRATDFIDVVAWRQTAEFVAKYFAKGSLLSCTGRLEIREWTDREGNKRRNAEVLADHVYFGSAKQTTEKTLEPAEEVDDGDLPF